MSLHLACHSRDVEARDGIAHDRLQESTLLAKQGGHAIYDGEGLANVVSKAVGRDLSRSLW